MVSWDRGWNVSKQLRHGQFSADYRRAMYTDSFISAFVWGFGLTFGAVTGLMLPLLLVTWWGLP